ncbi:MAG TPA: aminoglycoside phosphotransferase family protein [Sumerlaeia bacterium]|nr:aminoglycoside phosphotransferase family protein [Sumerlaeia bacterium]
MSRPPLPHSFALIRGLLLRHFNLWAGAPEPAAERPERFETYLREEIAGRRLIPSPCEEGFRIVPVGRGSNPIVRKIERDSAEPLVARCFPRTLGKEKSREHGVVSQLLRKAGLDVPRLVFADSSLRTLGRHGFDVVVEEWVGGRHPEPGDFDPADSPYLEKMADILSRLHDESAPRPGRPWRRRRARAPFLDDFFVARERQALHALRESDCVAPEEAEWRAVKGILEDRRPELDCGAPYALVHGDLQARNLLIRSDGSDSIALLDFGTAHYGLWPWDFVGFFNGSAGRNAQRTRRLLDLYLRKRPAARVEHFRALWPYLRVWYHLDKAAAAVRKRRRALGGRPPEGDPEFFARRAAKHWSLAVQAAESPELQTLG